ncbi:hypothetical protein U3516DRAFT_824014 [Neocallimastix sp. 'constans']|jgi:RsiW-degrading membrane proteinase PrsW (M82 family)
MGNIDRCICCLSKKTSALVCTIITLIISIYQFITEFTIVNTNKYLNSYENLTCLKVDINIPIRWISLIVNFILCLCLIQLIFGILKQKVSLMRPFKYVFIIFLLFTTVNAIYSIYSGFKRTQRIAEMDIDAEIDEYITKTYGSIDKESAQYQYFSNFYYDTCSKSGSLFFVLFILLFTNIIIMTFSLAYFIITMNYINGVEQEAKVADNYRNVENA